MRRPRPGLPASSTSFRRSAFLGILGLYSLYLLHTGIAALMKPPADKALIYTIVVVVVRDRGLVRRVRHSRRAVRPRHDGPL